MGADKATLELDGKTLLERAVVFCQSFCNQVIIGSNSVVHEFPGVLRVPDEYSDCGPMGGIYSCLKKSENEWNFVLSVDAAFVEPGFVTFLISEAGDFDAVIPVHKNGKEPLIAFYKRNILPQIKLQLEKKEFKMHFLFEKLKVSFVDSDEWISKYPNLFHNMNSREDLLNFD